MDCFDVEDSFHLWECSDITNSMDLSFHDKEIQHCYELCTGGEKNYETKFSFCPIAAPYSEYVSTCFYLSNSFGCDSMNKRSQYCILNKQYSKEDYEALKLRIIEHMKQRGEYGEFFPIQNSLFAYNESIAQDFFPLTKEEAEVKGYRWKDLGNAVSAPSLNPEVLNCKDCSKQYRVIPQEATLQEKIGVQTPVRCWDCRRKQLYEWKKAD